MKKIMIVLLLLMNAWSKDISFDNTTLIPTNKIILNAPSDLSDSLRGFPVKIQSKLIGKKLTLYFRKDINNYSEVISWKLNENTIIDYEINLKNDLIKLDDNIKVVLETEDGRLLTVSQTIIYIGCGGE